MSLNIPNHRRPGRRIAAACSIVLLALAASGCSTAPPAGAKLVNADALRPMGRIRTQLNTRDFQKSFAGGTTVLRLAIGADGKVDDIRIAESSGNASVDAAAARSLVGAAFVPYRENGVAIPVTTLMPMRFSPSGCIMAKPLDC
ncbi:TonB family protein [Xylophilus rhododendri]|uniref:TonB family protein n=1 Tax=Xylophilus rhododendri TaxID=2697032 RepID=A0A857JB13_9BURK|nr:energy transducer TonB [Xylophilus rhododendri]QHJ00394.1 TonB family protein [Xylophilus rhododendri]